MPEKSAPNFHQMLSWLMTEVIYARAHMTIVKGLKRADRGVVNAAPVFFDMTMRTHADSVVLIASKLFDHHRGSISIHALLPEALRHAGTFKHGTAVEVRKIVGEAKACISSLEPILKAIHKRRNETMAHSDPGPIVDPHQYVQEGRVSYPELDSLFEQTGMILNRFFQLYRGFPAPLDFVDVNDYKKALDLIAVGLRSS
jgi:hypothetical protein